MRFALLVMLGSLGLAGCDVAHDDGGGETTADAGAPSLVWVLVHPSDAPLGPGLYLFDEDRQVVVRRLPAPDISSPHALAWDGESLWLGGADLDDPAVVQMDPLDGRELSRWPGVWTEGIAFDGTDFWYGPMEPQDRLIRRVDHSGSVLASFTLADGDVVQDMVSANGALYYLVNDDEDRIVRVDTESGSTVEVARGVHQAPYSLGFDGTYLAVAVDGRILRFDTDSGALVRDDPFAVLGWITAIAFVR